MSNSKEPIRELECKFDDNGHPSWSSFPSHKNCQVRGGCDLPPHLPGIIILVHGVNSTGEWFESAEESLCVGLNKRLGLEKPYLLIKNKYKSDSVVSTTPLVERDATNTKESNSPVIRFYWGYSSPKGNEDKYVIPLANRKGVDYHQLKMQGVSHESIIAQGPFFWGGGPFQNGTNNLHSLWSEKGFKESVAGIKVQWFNEDKDRLLTNAPPRKYYAHAAKRLADMVDSIRNKYPKDTVTIISHSQGTMVAMAAVAIAEQAPDALFVLNSPYALDHNDLNGASLPAEECISPKGRQSTLSAIVDKVASRKNHLSSLGYEGLCVGQTADKKNWRPDVTLADENGTSLTERDNHGRTYIYFCPHDRVMGSRPLRSIGWQGLPNDSQGHPHPLLKKHQGNLFQRMLARSAPCGEAPNPVTPFAKLPDGKPFWDDKGDQYQSSSFTYPDPPEWQTVFINAEKVPEPIDATKLANFDVTRVGMEHDARQIDGWGEFNPDKKNKNDNTYDNYINLYPNQDIVIGFKNLGTQSEPRLVPVTRKETFEEKDARLRTYVSQPTDHSTLPMRADFMSQVVAYDLPIGYCDATWDKEFMADLRRKADWVQGEDPYLFSGIPDKVPEPDLISRDTVGDEFNTEQRKLPAYRVVNKA
jgi:pimeloyl-ACP methyl ester carboxylesterase